MFIYQEAKIIFSLLLMEIFILLQKRLYIIIGILTIIVMERLNYMIFLLTQLYMPIFLL